MSVTDYSVTEYSVIFGKLQQPRVANLSIKLVVFGNMFIWGFCTELSVIFGKLQQPRIADLSIKLVVLGNMFM